MRTRETSSIALLDDHRPRPAADRRLGRRSTTVAEPVERFWGSELLVSPALGAVGRHAPSVT